MGQDEINSKYVVLLAKRLICQALEGKGRYGLVILQRRASIECLPC